MSTELFSQELAANDPLYCAAYFLSQLEANEENDHTIFLTGAEFLFRDKVDEAATLADMIVESSLRDELLCMTAEKCIELNDDEYAFQLVDAIERESSKESGLEFIASALLDRGDIPEAVKLAERALHSDKIWTRIASKHFLDGNNSSAIASLKNLHFPEDLNNSFSEAVETLYIQGNTEQAVAVIDDVVRYIGVSEFSNDTRLLVNAAASFNHIEHNQKAVELLKIAFAKTSDLGSYERNEHYLSISNGALLAGDAQLADDALDKINDDIYLTEALADHAEIYFDQGKLDVAQEVLDEAYTLYLTLPRYSQKFKNKHFEIEKTIASQYARQGRESQAAAFIKTIANAKERDAIVFYAATGAADAGKVELALRLADLALEPEKRLNILSYISVDADIREFILTEHERTDETRLNSSSLLMAALQFNKFADAMRSTMFLDKCYGLLDRDKQLFSAVTLIEIAQAHRIMDNNPTTDNLNVLAELSA